MSTRGGRKFHNNRGYGRGRNFSSRGRDFTRGNKCSKFIAQERLAENEVGITEYIGDLPGFSGIIKARYSDFHVNEINNEGEIAKLTDLSVPKGFNFEKVTGKMDVKECPLLELISQEKWTDLNNMLNSDADDTVVVIDVASVAKEDRAKIHECVKETFGAKVVAETKLDGDNKSIEFKKYTKGSNADTRSIWPKDKGVYVYFLVYKEAVDTLEASFRIGECLKIKSSAFTYAGVKDRRAKTTQWFCMKKVDPRKLVNSGKFLRNIHIGNITFKDEVLKLGQLSGNRFKIALRNVIADDSLINDSLESLKSKGFINYYGLQRFGNDKEVPTFEIGIKLLQGNWKEACNLILKPKLSDDPDSEITKAKKVYNETSNPSLAHEECNRASNKCVESKLLLGLIKNHENDYVNALENIPRNMRLLYLHSFQSLVWNKIVSRRIKEYGLKPIVGDLVVVSSPEQSLSEVVEIFAVRKDDEDACENNPSHQEVKFLTESDLNTHTIYDIVLPLPGYDVKYPDNDVKNWYREILQEYNLTLEMPKQKVKTYTLSGAYRKIMNQVKDISWRSMKYDHPNDTLILSDYEELKGEVEPKDNPDGQYKALIVEFSLESSSYATMVLREILKSDTSSSAHAKLNDYHVTKHADTSMNKIEEPVTFAEDNSLLTDAVKYEAFKNLIYGDTATENSLKRKADGQDKDDAVKKSKVEVEDSAASIKIQPSLI